MAFPIAGELPNEKDGGERNGYRCALLNGFGGLFMPCIPNDNAGAMLKNEGDGVPCVRERPKCDRYEKNGRCWETSERYPGPYSGDNR